MLKSSDYIDDKTLWDNLRAGNKNAFNDLFRKFYSELFYYGVKITPNADLVEECIQEVFIRIWETRLNLSDVKNIKSYLLISLRRLVLLKKEKEKKYSKLDIDSAEKYSFLFEENEFEKHKEIQEEVRTVLLDAINLLTKKQRELIMLFFFHELSYPDIAQVMDISVPSVRNLMYRTLVRLRDVIGTDSISAMQNILFFFFSSKALKSRNNLIMPF